MKNRIIIILSLILFISTAFSLGKPDRFKKYTKIKSEIKLKKKEKESIIQSAKSFLGTKYKYAGLSKNGIDCSGLVFLAFKDVGVSIPKVSDAMAYEGKVVWNIKDLKPGDLVFFEKTYNSRNTITHVGIHVENSTIIHAASSKGVSYANLNNNKYWISKFAFGKRF